MRSRGPSGRRRLGGAGQGRAAPQLERPPLTPRIRASQRATASRKAPLMHTLPTHDRSPPLDSSTPAPPWVPPQGLFEAHGAAFAHVPPCTDWSLHPECPSASLPGEHLPSPLPVSEVTSEGSTPLTPQEHAGQRPPPPIGHPAPGWNCPLRLLPSPSRQGCALHTTSCHGA